MSGLTALLILAACGDSDDSLDPQLRAPETGTYTYEALVVMTEDAEPDTFSGTLVVDVASEDSIVGAWSVNGYDALARAIWNINAYTLPADPTPPRQGTITHRVWRQNHSTNLSCALTYERVTAQADTFRSSTENDCALIRSGN